MDCVFSSPVDYQGNAPTNDITPFAFQNAHCSTPSASLITQTASSTAVYFDANTTDAIHDFIYVFYIFAILILVYIGFKLGTYLYRR